MRKLAVLFVIVLCCVWAVAQAEPPAPPSELVLLQHPAPPAPPPPGAGQNVFFRTEKTGNKVTVGYFAITDDGKTITNAPYLATSTTETTQVLADGNRIVNKTEAQVARDSQGRTRRQDTMSNLGALATNAPKMVFITDPVAKANYILDLNAKTAEVIKFPNGATAPSAGGQHQVVKIIRKQGGPGSEPTPGGPVTVDVEKRVMMDGPGGGVEQRVWVNAEDEGQVKTESLGTQTIEAVSAEGTRTTRTIPAGQIGNERPIEIVSEVWTSPDLQMIVLSKRTDPRFGETVYKLTDIKRVDPEPSLFQVPSGFTTRTPDMTAPEPPR